MFLTEVISCEMQQLQQKCSQSSGDFQVNLSLQLQLRFPNLTTNNPRFIKPSLHLTVENQARFVFKPG